MDDPHRLTLRAVEIFTTVVDAGALGEGARRLGAASSTVSQQIANLEQALGVTLIDRKARPLTLTAAGRLFHARAMAILDQVALARSELSELDLSAVRELTLALLEDFEADVLPDLLMRLAGVFANCNFVARTGYSHENLVALERRSADLVVSADIEDAPDWLDVHPIVRDPLILVTAPGLTADNLDAPMVRFNRAQHLARLIETHMRRVRLSPPRRFEVETNSAMIALVARARGWAITTPLGLLSSGWTGAQVDAHPLPFAATGRIIALCARTDVLGHLPGAVATLFREVVADRAITRAHAAMPWLGDGFRVLDPTFSEREV